MILNKIIKMTQIQKDNFYKNLTNVLLLVITTFGIYSMVLLHTVNSKMNDQTLQITLLQQQLETHQRESEATEKRITKLESIVYKIPQ
jgi:cell division protein FtsB